MKWKPPDVVAFVLAICVLVFFISGTALRILIFKGVAYPGTTEQIAAWENMINVIIGALAGYIAGRSSNTDLQK